MGPVNLGSIFAELSLQRFFNRLSKFNFAPCKQVLQQLVKVARGKRGELKWQLVETAEARLNAVVACLAPQRPQRLSHMSRVRWVFAS
jgi:hypothetical protein